MKRVIIDGHGLADQAALVMETIKSGPDQVFGYCCCRVPSHAFRDLEEQPTSERNAHGPADQGIYGLEHQTASVLGRRRRNANHMRVEPHSRERSFESERRAQPDGYSLTDLNEHRLDEIGGEKPRASLAVGDQNKHHGAVRTRHDRVIAGRKRSRNRRNCDVERPHELELLGCKISDLGNRLDGG